MIRAIREMSREEWSYSGQVALKVGATLSFLSLLAVMAAHSPRDRADGPSSAPQTVAAKVMTTPGTADTKLDSMPAGDFRAPTETEEGAPPRF